MDWILSSLWFNKRISSQISHWSLKNSKWKIMDFVFEKLSYFEVVVSVDNLVNRFVQIYMTWRQFWWSTTFAINISNLRLLCGGSSVKGFLGENRIWGTAKCFGTPFCISILKLWRTRILGWIIWSTLLYFTFKTFKDKNSLSFIICFNEFCVIQNYFSQIFTN